MGIEIPKDRRKKIATGRDTNERPAFPEQMLESVVTGDQRIHKDLAPAAKAIKDKVTFAEFQGIRAENPGASADEIIKLWKAEIDKAGDTYAAKLSAHLKSLFDDFMAVARFRTRDDRHGEAQRVGIGPSSDESKAILSLSTFRNIAVIKTLKLWASAIRPSITKTSAFQHWHKKLRFRKRYKEFEKHINETREFF